jgi:hypothetical protein
MVSHKKADHIIMSSEDRVLRNMKLLLSTILKVTQAGAASMVGSEQDGVGWNGGAASRMDLEVQVGRPA